MSRPSKAARYVAGGWALLCVWAAPVLTAQAPQRIDGTFAAGVYSLGSESAGTVVPAGVEFGVGGYFGHPDFLTYSVQPWFNFGDPFGGLSIRSGNGLIVRSSFLRKRAFPVSLAYTRSKSRGNTLDPTGISFGLSRLGTENSQSSIAVSGSLLFRRLPSFSYSYARDRITSAVDTREGENGSASRGQSYQLGVSHDVFHWKWRLNYSNRETSSELKGTGGGLLLDTGNDLSSLDFSGHGKVWSLGQMVFRVERVANEIRLGRSQQTSEGQRALANFTSQPLPPLSLSASVLLESGRFESRLFSPFLTPGAGSSIPSPQEPLLFAPSFDHYTTQVQGRYKIHSDWMVFASLGQSSATSRTSELTSSRGSGSSTGLGVLYTHAYRWAALSASYSRAFSRTDASSEDRTSGQDAVRVALQGGRLFSLNWDADVQFSRQNLDGQLTSVRNPLSDRQQNLSMTYTLRRNVGAFDLRGSAALQKSSASLRDVARTEVDTSNWAFSFGARHRRFDLQYDRNLQEQSSLLPLDSTLNPLLTSLDSTTVRGRVNLLPGLETDVLYRSARNTFFADLGSQFRNLIVTARYRFRQLELEGGYNHVEITNFLSEAGKRSGFYLRVIRRFRIL